VSLGDACCGDACCGAAGAGMSRWSARSLAASPTARSASSNLLLHPWEDGINFEAQLGFESDYTISAVVSDVVPALAAEGGEGPRPPNEVVVSIKVNSVGFGPEHLGARRNENAGEPLERWRTGAHRRTTITGRRNTITR